MLYRVLPRAVFPRLYTRLTFYLLVLGLLSLILAGVLWAVYWQAVPLVPETADRTLFEIVGRTFLLLFVLTGVMAWWVVLTWEARYVAQRETTRQTALLKREIRAHERTDAKLKAAKREADAANQAKSRYVSGLSHELRTPLNNVLGYTQLLLRDEVLATGQRDKLDTIQRSGEHLLALVDGLLDIARIEAGRIALNNSPIDTRAFIAQLRAIFVPQAEAKQLDLRIEWSGRVPVMVRGDEQRLRQILINLLSNAIRFTETGTVRLRIAYASEVASFEVIDTGPGIDAARLADIFLPFERLDAPASANTPGTGLGLTISQLLAHLMGGDLAVKPGPADQGSHFTLRVFLARMTPPPTPAAPAVDRTVVPVEQHRALVVDDLADQRALIGDALLPLGFRVDTCADGPAALRFLAGESVDLIVMDVGLPEMDGFETIGLIRARRLSEAPILVISANAYAADIARSQAVGCDGYLAKPIDLNELEETVAALLHTVSTKDTKTDREAIDGPEKSVTTEKPAPARTVRRATDDLPRLYGRLEAAAEAGAMSGVGAMIDRLEKTDVVASDMISRLREAARRFDFEGLKHIAQTGDVSSTTSREGQSNDDNRR